MTHGASIRNSVGRNQVTVHTGPAQLSIEIPAKPSGFGSKMNGGEALSLALATCYCNDIYREAARRGIQVESVEVDVEGEFLVEGAAAKSLTYRAKVTAHASADQIHDLMKHTDTVSEIQNTLRAGLPVVLTDMQAVSRP